MRASLPSGKVGKIVVRVRLFQPQHGPCMPKSLKPLILLITAMALAGGGGGGGGKGGGFFGWLADKLGPSTADTIPIPLLVLGGLALTLLLAAAVSFFARRMQARRAATDPQPPHQRF